MDGQPTNYEATFAAWIEAFTTFSKYSAGFYDVGADHDVVYVYVDPKDVEQTDLVRLKDLGWHADFDAPNFNKYV